MKRLMSPRLSDTRTLAAWVVGEGCWVLASLGLLALVLRCGVNLPYMDEWPMVEALASPTPPWAWIFDWHNEHLLPLPRFLFWFAYSVGHDLRVSMLFSVVLWSALARLLMSAARSARGGPAYSDALFPLLLLHAGQYENVLMSYQLGFSLSAFLAGCAYVTIARPPSPRRLALVVACVVLLPGCGGHGLIFAVPVMFWLVLVTSMSRSVIAFVGVVLGLVAASVYLWLPGQPLPASKPPLSVFRWMAGVFGFFAGGFGPFGERVWPATAALPAFVWVAVLITAWRSRRQCRELQYLGGLAAVCGVTLLAAAIAWGRSRYGLHAVFFPRYAGLAALLPAFAVLFGLRYGMGRIATVVFVAALVAFPFNTWSGWHSSEALAEIQRCAQHDLANGVPVEVIARQFHHLIYNDPAAVVGFIERYTPVTHEPASRAIPLPPPTANGPVREVEPGAWLATGPASLDYTLPVPQFAYAVVLRGQYRYPALWPPARATISIRREPDGEFEVHTRPVFRLPTPHLGDTSIMLWLPGNISAVRIHPDDHAWGLRITSAELLVPNP